MYFIYYTNQTEGQVMFWAYSLACHLFIKIVKIQPPTNVLADIETLAAGKELKASICGRVAFAKCK